MLRRLLLAAWALGAAAPALAQTHFHHAHLNSTDPAAAIDFYTTHLSGEKATFDGRDAVWTQKSWLLFTKVKQAPPHDIVSPLFHIGWGAEDMKAEFERQMKLGTTFQTVLTDGVELFGAGTRDRNFFMYLDGPDHVTIEVQSAMHHDFMHVHLFSDDPVAVSVDDLDATLARLKQEGVKVVSGPRKADGLRSAFIEAPDKMELELVEGHARP